MTTKAKRYIEVGNDLVDEKIREPIVLADKRSPIWTYAFYGFLVTVIVAFNLAFSFSRVSGHSMQPTLHHNDFVLFLRTKKVKRFDVVSLRERLTDRGTEKLIVKRIIGLPGDHITSIDGQLYVNNEKIAEDYLDHKFTKAYDKMSYTITVPKGHVFVLGDNRDVSKDSRMLGSFKESAIIGTEIMHFKGWFGS